jgi:hypothetical protein
VSLKSDPYVRITPLVLGLSCLIQGSGNDSCIFDPQAGDLKSVVTSILVVTEFNLTERDRGYLWTLAGYMPEPDAVRTIAVDVWQPMLNDFEPNLALLHNEAWGIVAANCTVRAMLGLDQKSPEMWNTMRLMFLDPVIRTGGS